MAALERAIFSDAYSDATVRETLAAAYGLSLGAFSDGRLSGYLLGTVVADEAEVLRVGVHPDMRRAGAGLTLLRAFLKEAKETGAGAAYLEVRADNLPAVNLYEKAGFTRTGVRRGYYKRPDADALLFKISLE